VPELSKELREVLAKVGTSTLTGVLNRKGLHAIHSVFGPWYRRAFADATCPQCARLPTAPNW
jgi:hypothetical protein